jgi:hypothetical protein
VIDGHVFCVSCTLQVLSVIAQQILTMQQAKVAGLKVFEFEGTRLSLRCVCVCGRAWGCDKPG